MVGTVPKISIQMSNMLAKPSSQPSRSRLVQGFTHRRGGLQNFFRRHEAAASSVGTIRARSASLAAAIPKALISNGFPYISAPAWCKKVR
ncbi:hypothetical protein [Noviherbaspirillum aerium]|uniref:hypothetical protein n=1 Tax=Noviherbaspirillum aerium TaxID=2588497 RepID=UPI00178C63FE|nr:hypothetical protein [Noviherbaspirillum aerium]